MMDEVGTDDEGRVESLVDITAAVERLSSLIQEFDV
jgi:hypothetical protein